MAVLRARFPGVSVVQQAPKVEDAIRAMVSDEDFVRQNGITVAKEFHRDLRTWTFQRISTAASILSDGIPSIVTEKFHSTSEAARTQETGQASSSADSIPRAGHRPGLQIEMQLVRDFLRSVSASFAPEAYSTKGAILAIVGLTQAGLTRAWNPRSPTKQPSSSALPIHALDLVTGLVEQVSYTLEHWGDGGGEQRAPGKWINAVQKSAKYFARIGEMLTMIDNVEWDSML